VAGTADLDHPCFDAVIEVVEQLGSEILLDMKVARVSCGERRADARSRCATSCACMRLPGFTFSTRRLRWQSNAASRMFFPLRNAPNLSKPVRTTPPAPGSAPRAGLGRRGGRAGARRHIARPVLARVTAMVEPRHAASMMRADRSCNMSYRRDSGRHSSRTRRVRD